MAWIKNTDPEQAQGLLEKIYRDAVKRAGKVWQILQIQSQNPKQLRASMGLYQACMSQDSALPARLRETLAVVVSKANHCVY
jgi:alkylhydroperoxidase family enzyme